MRRISLSVTLLALTAIALTPTVGWAQAFVGPDNGNSGVPIISDGGGDGGPCTQRGGGDVGSDDCPANYSVCLGDGRVQNYTYECRGDAQGDEVDGMYCQRIEFGVTTGVPSCV